MGFYGILLDNVGGCNVISQPFVDGWNPTHENGDDWGMVYYCYTNIIEHHHFEEVPKLKPS